MKFTFVILFSILFSQLSLAQTKYCPLAISEDTAVLLAGVSYTHESLNDKQHKELGTFNGNFEHDLAKLFSKDITKVETQVDFFKRECLYVVTITPVSSSSRYVVRIDPMSGDVLDTYWDFAYVSSNNQD